MILFAKIIKGMAGIFFESGMPFVYLDSCKAILAGLSHPHHCSSVYSVPQVFYINHNLRTVTVKL